MYALSLIPSILRFLNDCATQSLICAYILCSAGIVHSESIAMSLSVDDAPAGWLQAVAALLCVSLSVRAALYVRDWLTRGRSAPLPPGPRGWPIIGNALDFPKHDRGRGFKELSAKYGRYLT